MNQRFAFHLSFCLRAAALADAPFAIFNDSVYFGGYPVCEPSELHSVYERDDENEDENSLDSGAFKGRVCSRLTMSLHNASWRVNASAIDDLELLETTIVWLAGNNSKFTLKKDKSWHGSPHHTLVATVDKRRPSIESLARLGNNTLQEILEGDISQRIDEEKILHIRLRLDRLVNSEAVLVENKFKGASVKGKFKIESYPGDNPEIIVTELINKIVNS